MMQIRVVKIHHQTENGFLITFALVHATERAIWSGHSPPELDAAYTVETDLHDDFVWGENIHLIEEEAYLFESTDKDLHLKGRIDTVIDKNLYVIIDEFTRASVDLTVSESLGQEGDFVEIYSRQIVVFDTNI